MRIGACGLGRADENPPMGDLVAHGREEQALCRFVDLQLSTVLRPRSDAYDGPLRET